MHSTPQPLATLSAWRHFAQAYGEGSYDSGTYNNASSSKPATEPTTSYPPSTNASPTSTQDSPSSSVSSDSPAHTQTTSPPQTETTLSSQAKIADAIPTAPNPGSFWGIALFIIIVGVVVVGAVALIKHKLSHR